MRLLRSTLLAPVLSLAVLSAQLLGAGDAALGPELRDRGFRGLAGSRDASGARELFELHSLGAEHYEGVIRQNQVPTGPGGVPVGYVDDDVFEATRCFTGWTFDFDTGLFEFNQDWHDQFQKFVLGTYIPANQPGIRDDNPFGIRGDGNRSRDASRQQRGHKQLTTDVHPTLPVLVPGRSSVHPESPVPACTS